MAASRRYIRNAIFGLKATVLAFIFAITHSSFATWVLAKNKNHFVTFTGATFVLATHVFFINKFAGDMNIFFIANIL